MREADISLEEATATVDQTRDVKPPIVKRPALLDRDSAGVAPAYRLSREQDWQKREQRAQIHAKRAAYTRANAAAKEKHDVIDRACMKALTATNSMPRVVELDDVKADWQKPESWELLAPDLRRWDDLELRFGNTRLFVTVVSVDYHLRRVQVVEQHRQTLPAAKYQTAAPGPTDMTGMTHTAAA